MSYMDSDCESYIESKNNSCDDENDGNDDDVDQMRRVRTPLSTSFKDVIQRRLNFRIPRTYQHSQLPVLKSRKPPSVFSCNRLNIQKILRTDVDYTSHYPIVAQVAKLKQSHKSNLSPFFSIAYERNLSQDAGAKLENFGAFDTMFNIFKNIDYHNQDEDSTIIRRSQQRSNVPSLIPFIGQENNILNLRQCAEIAALSAYSLRKVNNVLILCESRNSCNAFAQAFGGSSETFAYIEHFLSGNMRRDAVPIIDQHIYSLGGGGSSPVAMNETLNYLRQPTRPVTLLCMNHEINNVCCSVPQCMSASASASSSAVVGSSVPPPMISPFQIPSSSCAPPIPVPHNPLLPPQQQQQHEARCEDVHYLKEMILADKFDLIVVQSESGIDHYSEHVHSWMTFLQRYQLHHNNLRRTTSEVDFKPSFIHFWGK